MRKPHRTIGVNYLERWYIIPRNRWFNVYLHKFSGSDDGRAQPLRPHSYGAISGFRGILSSSCACLWVASQ